MKKYIALITIALALVACKKQGPVEGPVSGAGEILTAHIGGPDSKVEFNPSTGKFAWSDPDMIALFTTDGFKNVSVSPSGVFTFVPDEGVTRAGYAFYPADVKGGDADAPKVILPSSYDLASEGMGDWYPTPMIAVNNPSADDLWFYHLGGALHLTLNGVPAFTKTIAISVGKGITGSFTVNNPDTKTPSIVPGDTPDEVSFVLENALEEVGDGIVINVPLPAGTYSKIMFIAKNAGGDVITSGGSYKEWTFPRGRGRQLTYDFALNITGSNEFSVSSTKKVEFALGNLQYISGTWQMAEHQYDKLSGYSADAWDLFGYSKGSSNNYGATTSTLNEDYFGSFVDWGNAIGGGWRTLSGSEWSYLLGKFRYIYDAASDDDVICAPVTDFGRNGGNPHALRGLATIYTAAGAVPGFVILPDEWTLPEGCAAFVGGKWQRSNKSYLDNTYNAGGTAGTSGEWSWMEAAGAIFLPACGARVGQNIADSVFNGYWSSSYNETAAEGKYMLGAACVFSDVDDDNYGSDNLIGLAYGLPVRLVKDRN